MVTRDSSFFPPRTRKFLSEHYVPVGTVRVAGQRVRGDGTFAVAIPGEYVVLDGAGKVVRGKRSFPAGRHRLPPGLRARAATVVWWGMTRR